MPIPHAEYLTRIRFEFLVRKADGVFSSESGFSFGPRLCGCVCAGPFSCPENGTEIYACFGARPFGLRQPDSLPASARGVVSPNP